MATTTLIAVTAVIGGGYCLFKSLLSLGRFNREIGTVGGDAILDAISTNAENAHVVSMKENLKYSAALFVGAVAALGLSYVLYPSNKPGAAVVAVASELRKTIDTPAPKAVVQIATPIQATQKPEKPAYFCPIENTAYNVCIGLNAVNIDPSNWQRIKNGAQEVVDIAAINCTKADLEKALIVGETAAKWPAPIGWPGFNLMHGGLGGHG